MRGRQNTGQRQRHRNRLAGGALHVAGGLADIVVEALALGSQTINDHVEVEAEGREDDGFLNIGLQVVEAVDTVLAREGAAPAVRSRTVSIVSRGRIVAEIDQQGFAELVSDEAKIVLGHVLKVAPGDVAGLIGRPGIFADPVTDLPFGDFTRLETSPVDTGLERPQRVEKVGEVSIGHVCLHLRVVLRHETYF